MKRWEYEELADADSENIDRELNEAGAEGWEVVGVYVLNITGAGQVVRYVMKRELE